MISGLYTLRWASGQFFLRTKVVWSDRTGAINVLTLGLIGRARSIAAESKSSARSAGMLALVIP